MHISSDIYFRFATTVVETKILNSNQEASEIMFDMTLPDSSFITGFTMEIGGKRYAGNVKENDKAKKQFEVAKRRGESAGHIAASGIYTYNDFSIIYSIANIYFNTPRTTNKLNILVNVEKNALVIFKLKYQELLKRTLCSYQHVIHLDPGQIVEDFKLKVCISESREIIDLTMPPLEGMNTTDVDKFARIKHISPSSIDITYAPSVQNQTMSEQGISGQFIVKYDVTRDKDAGDLLVLNGYFIHMFAPKDFKPLPKDVMFVLDKSWSMFGRKIIQLKEAMKLIMQDMKPEDRFNIVFFDQNLDWLSKTDMLQWTKQNFGSAERFIEAVTASGNNNMNKAVKDGITFLNKYLDTQKSTILMFLTDGQPTTGETRPASILQNVRIANEARLPIVSLGFGNNLDFDFLKQISVQNSGFARRIYEDADASLQIKGLYAEISTALLKNVSFNYVGDIDMNTLTQTRYPSYFEGSELIVAGKIRSNGSYIVPRVNGWNNGFMDLIWKPTPVPDLKAVTTDTDIAKITEKMLAYLTIKQLLIDIENDITTATKDKIKSKIISLATKKQRSCTGKQIITHDVDSSEFLSGSHASLSLRPPHGIVSPGFRRGSHRSRKLRRRMRIMSKSQLSLSGGNGKGGYRGDIDRVGQGVSLTSLTSPGLKMQRLSTNFVRPRGCGGSCGCGGGGGGSNRDRHSGDIIDGGDGGGRAQDLQNDSVHSNGLKMQQLSTNFVRPRGCGRRGGSCAGRDGGDEGGRGRHSGGNNDGSDGVGRAQVHVKGLKMQQLSTNFVRPRGCNRKGGRCGGGGRFGEGGTGRHSGDIIIGGDGGGRTQGILL
ncbi:Ca-activated chloride channel homolog [Mytilus galloprovincialis]|uniref:Ca-activated chloride channel homolog n=1 Tax=Mytilus galloprovincialis TaxID=29158 RepID=A0A8B6GVF2_MYTGA|nr:Ca-activated chloride channel homolog [Mytilus galloprovincialis]